MLERELTTAIELARGAGRILLEIYARDFAVAYKSKNDPVTEADQRANAYLVDELRARFPGDGVVAEETADQSGALAARRCWFVDPLDGTKEFIAKNGEFAVMIGLAIDGESVLGVVYQASKDKLYAGVVGDGAWLYEGSTKTKLHVSTKEDPSALRLVVSRSHRPQSIERIMKALGATEEMPSGSVGVKVGLIVERAADLYVHISDKSSLWDACGPEAIMRAAGGYFAHVDGTGIRYDVATMQNTKGILAVNAGCYERVLAAVTEAARAEGFIEG